MILDMCQVMGCVVFSSDIVDVARLGTYEVSSDKPPPVRVTFDYTYQRNNMLRNKSNLAGRENFENIYINPDDPIEMRRMRGIFRKVAYKARADGKEVVMRAEWIKIDQVTYLASELDRIPAAYMPDIAQRQYENSKENAGAVGGEPENDGNMRMPMRDRSPVVQKNDSQDVIA